MPQEGATLIEWAIFHTFDAFSGRCDQPALKCQIVRWDKKGTCSEVA